MKEEMSADEMSAMEAMRDVAPIKETREEQPQETVAETPPAPEPAPVAEDKPEPVKPPEGFVPHQAMHEERKRRQEAERQMAELRQRLEAIEKAKPAEPEADIPDPVVDPRAFQEWQRAELRKRDEAIESFRLEQHENTQRAALSQRVAMMEQEFIASKPDYTNALQHLAKVRASELQLLGVPQERISAVLNAEAMEIAQAALSSERNPAELVYQIAQARGYAPKAAEPTKEPASPVSEAARVMALAKAQAQTATLASAPGASTGPTYTLETLAKMDEAELAKIPADVKRRVLGG